MNKKILISGVALLALSVFAIGGIMAQPEEPETEQPAGQVEQQVERSSFVEILAMKLGIEVEALEQAMEEAREEFQAQLPERGERPGRGDRAERGERPNLRSQGEGEAAPEFEGRGPGAKGGNGGPGGRGQGGSFEQFFKGRGAQMLRNSGVEELHIHFHYEGGGGLDFGPDQFRGSGQSRGGQGRNR